MTPTTLSLILFATSASAFLRSDKEAGHALKLRAGAAPPPPLSSLPPGWSELGCFTDSVLHPTLDGSVRISQQNSPYSCASSCGLREYEYAGVEWGSECFCADKLTVSTVFYTGQRVPSTECSLKCPGGFGAGDACGGASRVQIFKYSTPPPVRNTTAAPPTTTTIVNSEGETVMSEISSPIPHTKYLGCYPTEHMANDPNTYLYSDIGITNDECSRECSSEAAGGSYYFFTASGNTCGCPEYSVGASAASSTVPDETRCIEPCSGNSTEVCGGSSYGSVYQFIST